MYNYGEVYTNLCFQAAVVSFFKKNGELRTMLCTRDSDMISFCCNNGNPGLGGHDKRCNINNGNIAVVDLVIGEARSFNIERVLHIEYLNKPIKSQDDLEAAIATLQSVREYYESKIEYDDIFESLDASNPESGLSDSPTTANTTNVDPSQVFDTTGFNAENIGTFNDTIKTFAD